MHEDVRNYVEELLANRPCPIDTWIHLQNCHKCSQELERLRKLSSLFPLRSSEVLEPAPFFYARVQERILTMRSESPWLVFLNTGFAKRLAFACLTATSLIAAYLLHTASQEFTVPAIFRPVQFTSLPATDQDAQRNAVLVNLVVDSSFEDEAHH